VYQVGHWLRLYSDAQSAKLKKKFPLCSGSVLRQVSLY